MYITIMKRKAILPTVLWLSVLISTVFSMPTYASNCADKTLTTKTTSLSYSSSYDTPKMKSSMEMRIKKFVNKMSKEQLMKAEKSIMGLKKKVSMDHPQYWVFDMVETLFKERMNQLENEKTIVETAMSVESLSTLVEVVKALDLVDTLNGEGSFTVFAPTNEAFAALLEQLDMSFEELAANTDLLRTVVLYHVLDSKVASKDVVWLQEWTLVTTLWGEAIRTSSRNGVKIDNASVIQADIENSNWIVHVIDNVLLPPSVLETLWLDTDRAVDDIATVAIETAQFPTLIAALEAADLVWALQADGPLTVYAPTEEAFTGLLSDLDLTAPELLANKELLTSVLTYHVVPGFYDSSDVLTIDWSIDSPTLNGKSVTISNTSEWPKVNDANIIQTDVYGSNGVIHVIDAVLIP